MRAALRLLAFPLVLGGAWAAAAIALARGASALAVVLIIPPLAAAAIIGLEHAIPYRRAWLRGADLRPDALHLVVSGWLVESLPTLAHGALVAAAAALADRLGDAPWPTTWPVALQVGLALVVLEAGHYGVHRAMHAVPALWRLHAVHHGAERLYWLNATRLHPLEAIAGVLATGWILVVAGAPANVLALVAVGAVTFRMLQHGNLDVRLGPLNLVFSMAEVHRWHHSTVRAEADANYGAMLLIWDWALGTGRRVVPGAGPADLGVVGPPPPRTWWAQLRSPWDRTRWSG